MKDHAIQSKKLLLEDNDLGLLFINYFILSTAFSYHKYEILHLRDIRCEYTVMCQFAFL